MALITCWLQLNVYCEGDFFKSHIDTPHGTDMLGTLILCLPSPHTGGALTVKHNGQEVRRWLHKISLTTLFQATLILCLPRSHTGGALSTMSKRRVYLAS